VYIALCGWEGGRVEEENGDRVDREALWLSFRLPIIVYFGASLSLFMVISYLGKSLDLCGVLI
jgi:hypothetical protein